ncbi:6383_t:CDS:1, partial [Entrophospora sp. SA101]
NYTKKFDTSLKRISVLPVVYHVIVDTDQNVLKELIQQTVINVSKRYNLDSQQYKKLVKIPQQ